MHWASAGCDPLGPFLCVRANWCAPVVVDNWCAPVVKPIAASCALRPGRTASSCGPPKALPLVRSSAVASAFDMVLGWIEPRLRTRHGPRRCDATTVQLHAEASGDLLRREVDRLACKRPARGAADDERGLRRAPPD